MPERINDPEFQDMPPWARDMRDALYANDLAYKEARHELGYMFMDGREGQLCAEYTQRAEKILYNFLAMEDKTKLPEHVLLEKRTAPQQHLSMGGINIASHKPHATYFLPREEAVYEIDYTENTRSEFDPENENFVGFSSVETNTTNHNQPHNQNKLQAPLGIIKHQCKESDPWNWRLALSEISIVANSLKEYSTKSALETSATNLVQQINRLQQEFTEKIKERQIYHAEKIKNRVLQLKKAVETSIKLPEYIQGNTVEGMSYGNQPYYKILDTKNNQLVRAPLTTKKKIFRKEVKVPNMHKQQPSEPLDWLNSGVDFTLIFSVPKKIRDTL